MSTPVYHGGMPAFGNLAALQRAAEAESAQSEVNDMTAAETEGNPHLTGQTPTAAGSPCAAEVPNLVVTSVSTPLVTHGVPADAAASQSPLTAARPRAHR